MEFGPTTLPMGDRDLPPEHPELDTLARRTTQWLAYLQTKDPHDLVAKNPRSITPGEKNDILAGLTPQDVWTALGYIQTPLGSVKDSSGQLMRADSIYRTDFQSLGISTDTFKKICQNLAQRYQLYCPTIPDAFVSLVRNMPHPSEFVHQISQAAKDLGLRITFAQVNNLARLLYGKRTEYVPAGEKILADAMAFQHQRREAEAVRGEMIPFTYEAPKITPDEEAAQFGIAIKATVQISVLDRQGEQRRVDATITALRRNPLTGTVMVSLSPRDRHLPSQLEVSLKQIVDSRDYKKPLSVA